METLQRSALIVVVLASLALTAACEKGPMQKTGERLDRALGQEPVIGKGPVERAGKDADKTVDDIKR